MKHFILVFASGFIFTSCATLKEWGDKAMFWKDDEKTSETAEDGAAPEAATPAYSEPDGEFVNGVTPKEMELKQAKIWARLDEIENELRIQRAHIKVLEKGMKLGIVPEELLTGNYQVEQAPRAVPSRQKAMRASKPRVMVNQKSPKPVATKQVTQTGSEEDYKKLLSEGETQFRAGHYGKAIAVYEKIGRQYQQYDQQGSHRYWVALCWYRLKELEVAKDEFEGFLKSAQSSPWIPRAEYYLARIKIENGMLQSGLKGFREIVKKYPYDDTSEMARMEIERIEQRL